MYEIKDRYSIDEFERLSEFARTLVIKDEQEAEAAETPATARAGWAYADAALGLGGGYASEAERLQIVENFKEANPYYLRLLKERGVDPAIARTAKDFHILWHTNTALDQRGTRIFLELYYSTLTYFFKILYTKAFQDHGMSRRLMKVLIIFFTMERYVSARLEWATDVDGYDRRSLRNMFISYGLDFFDDLPEKYQRRVLKNLNGLLRNKGTTKAIVDIVGIFGFENVEIMKYYLAKEFKRRDDGRVRWNEPDVRFYKVPVDTVDFEREMVKATSYDFDSIVSGDPYWQAAKEDVLSKSFSYVNTKYIGADVGVSLMKEVLSLSYFVNLVRTFETRCRTEPALAGKADLLTVFDSNYSYSPIRISSLVVALQIVVIKSFGWADNIFRGASSAVYGYSIPDLEPYAVSPDLPETLDDAVRAGQTKPENFVDAFVLDGKYRKALEDSIVAAGDYRAYRSLLALWEAKCTIGFQTALYGDTYQTYSQYLASVDPSLLASITPDPSFTEQDRANFYRIKLNDLSGLLDGWIDRDGLDFILKSPVFSFDTIREYISRLIRIFKAYTIDFRDVNIIYLFDSKLFNTVRMFEELPRWDLARSEGNLVPYGEDPKFRADFDVMDRMMEAGLGVDEWIQWNLVIWWIPIPLRDRTRNWAISAPASELYDVVEKVYWNAFKRIKDAFETLSETPWMHAKFRPMFTMSYEDVVKVWLVAFAPRHWVPLYENDPEFAAAEKLRDAFERLADLHKFRDFVRSTEKIGNLEDVESFIMSIKSGALVEIRDFIQALKSFKLNDSLMASFRDHFGRALDYSFLHTLFVLDNYVQTNLAVFGDGVIMSFVQSTQKSEFGTWDDVAEYLGERHLSMSGYREVAKIFFKIKSHMINLFRRLELVEPSESQAGPSSSFGVQDRAGALADRHRAITDMVSSIVESAGPSEEVLSWASPLGFSEDFGELLREETILESSKLGVLFRFQSERLQESILSAATALPGGLGDAMSLQFEQKDISDSGLSDGLPFSDGFSITVQGDE